MSFSLPNGWLMPSRDTVCDKISRLKRALPTVRCLYGGVQRSGGGFHSFIKIHIQAKTCLYLIGSELWCVTRAQVSVAPIYS